MKDKGLIPVSMAPALHSQDLPVLEVGVPICGRGQDMAPNSPWDHVTQSTELQLWAPPLPCYVSSGRTFCFSQPHFP